MCRKELGADFGKYVDLVKLLLNFGLSFYAIFVASVLRQVFTSVYHKVEKVTFVNFTCQAVLQPDVFVSHVCTLHTFQLFPIVFAALCDKWHTVAVLGKEVHWFILVGCVLDPDTCDVILKLVLWNIITFVYDLVGDVEVFVVQVHLLVKILIVIDLDELSLRLRCEDSRRDEHSQQVCQCPVKRQHQ